MKAKIAAPVNVRKHPLTLIFYFPHPYALLSKIVCERRDQIADAQADFFLVLYQPVTHNALALFLLGCPLLPCSTGCFWRAFPRIIAYLLLRPATGSSGNSSSSLPTAYFWSLFISLSRFCIDFAYVVTGLLLISLATHGAGGRRKGRAIRRQTTNMTPSSHEGLCQYKNAETQLSPFPPGHVFPASTNRYSFH